MNRFARPAGQIYAWGLFAAPTLLLGGCSLGDATPGESTPTSAIYGGNPGENTPSFTPSPSPFPWNSTWNPSPSSAEFSPSPPEPTPEGTEKTPPPSNHPTPSPTDTPTPPYFTHAPVSHISSHTSEDVVTVVEVDWLMEEAGLTWVEYQCPGSGICESPKVWAEAGPIHQSLVGIIANSLIEYRIGFEIEGHQYFSESHLQSIPSLPDDLPEFIIDSHSPAAIDEPYILGSTISGTHEPLTFIIDRLGNLIWYHRHVDTGEDTSGWAIPAAFPSQDGGIILGLHPLSLADERGYIQWLGDNGKIRRQEEAPASHHQFGQGPEGIAAYIATDLREVEGLGMVAGDKLIEIDADGAQHTLFSTWDWEEPINPGNTDPDTQSHQWTHANGIHYDVASNTYLFSLHALQCILEIDAATGEVLHQLGGVDGDYQVSHPDYDFNAQHGIHYTQDDTLLMISTLQGETQAVEYAVDHKGKTLDPIWSYGQGLGISAFAYGGAQRLDNGHTLVNFGSEAIVHEVLPNGNPVWAMHLSEGYGIGLTHAIQDPYALFDGTGKIINRSTKGQSSQRP